MVNKEDKEIIENLMDKYSPILLLSTIAEICHDKAVHIAENWQDMKLARYWHFIGDRISAVKL
jgi:hypothetical protein